MASCEEVFVAVSTDNDLALEAVESPRIQNTKNANDEWRNDMVGVIKQQASTKTKINHCCFSMKMLLTGVYTAWPCSWHPEQVPTVLILSTIVAFTRVEMPSMGTSRPI